MYTVNNSEQLRELSSNDLNFLANDPSEDVNQNSNSTVRDLDNILDKFEADTQLLLENPNQLLNCKYKAQKCSHSISISCPFLPFSTYVVVHLSRYSCLSLVDQC